MQVFNLRRCMELQQAKMISLLAYGSIVFSFGFVVGLMLRDKKKKCTHDSVRRRKAIWGIGRVKCTNCRSQCSCTKRDAGRSS